MVGSSIVVTDGKITVNEDVEISKKIIIRMAYDDGSEDADVFTIAVVKTPLVPSQSIADYTQVKESSTTTVVTLEDAYTAGNTSEVVFSLEN